MAWALIALAALLLPLSSHADPAWAPGDPRPVPPLNARVTDQTGTLNAAQKDVLERKLASVEQAQGSQIVILIVPATAPEDIAAYAHRVASQWKVGRRDVGDGVLLLVAKNERAVRIDVAKALEGAIPDLTAYRIIDQAIRPAFKAGDYAGGLNLAIDQLQARIKGEGLPAPSGTAAQRSARSSGTQWDDLAIFLFIGVPIAGAVLTAVLGRKLGTLATGVAAGALGWWWTTSLLIAGVATVAATLLVAAIGTGARRGGSAGRWGAGGVGYGAGYGMGGGWGGGSSGNSGGGFSSGGGGDFGGGGASGNW